MSDLRDTLAKTLRLNETHIAAISAGEVEFTDEEAALIENLRASPAFKAFPKDQIDRHTVKQLAIAVCDFPVSVAERAGRKCELLISRGELSESLESVGNTLTEGGEGSVPEERDAAGSEGDGDLPQGDADTLSSEFGGEDHPSPGGERGEVDSTKDVTKQGDPGDGDSSGTAKKGYKQEEGKDVEHGHDEDDAFQLENDDDDEPELDEDGNVIPASGGDKDKAPDKDKGKLGEMDTPQDSMPSDMNEEGEEGSENDAPDPAPEEDRAASDATYKDGCKQNSGAKGESKDPKDADSDLADTPDGYNEITPEDPSNDPKNVGAADPKLESLAKVEERIKVILREAGIKKGSKKWNEAYVKGWTLAMEHRATLIGG